MPTHCATIFLLVLMALLPPVYAQNEQVLPAGDSGLRLQSAHFQQFTIEHGLPNNTTFIIIQDRKEFLWVAIRDGLVRYDGTTFKIYKQTGKLNHNFQQ